MPSAPSSAFALTPWTGFPVRAFDSSALRSCFLFAAILIYALFSSPTPNAPGFAEGAMALCLIMAAGIPGLARAFTWSRVAPCWFSMAQALLVYGLAVGIVAGITRGNDAEHMARDILPFLFLVLPLFLGDVFEGNPARQKRLAALMAFAGVAFSIRAAPEIIGWWRPGFMPKDAELYYFANAPCVLFAAIYLFSAALLHFARRFSFKGILLMVLAIGPVLAMALTLQRASLILFMLSFFLVAVVMLIRRPRRMILLGAVFVLLALPFVSLIQVLGGKLIEKNTNVGANARGAEAAAVWSEISMTPGTTLFGEGWGGMFNSPAVGNMRVNYTHSLLSAMLLKTGIAGFILTAFYLAALGANIFAAAKRNIILPLAVAAPFLIDIFFYASYKFFDFGLILLLLTAWARRCAVAHAA